MNIKAKAHIKPAFGNIVSLCRECSVEWLVLFGSSLKEGWDERRSDFDFGVRFEKQGGSFDKLQWGLLLLLKRNVHLIDVDAVQNPYFAQVIVTEGERVF